MSGNKFYGKSLASALLSDIANAADILERARTFREAIDLLVRQHKIPKANQQQAYDSLLYLNRRGYVHFQTFLKPTIKGKRLLKVIELLNVTLPRPATWDGKWRMVIFDVPNDKNNKRIAFKDKIKSLGFQMIQRSVWMYPYECGKEIDQLRTFYEIRDHVTFAVVSEIEDDAELKKRFNLA